MLPPTLDLTNILLTTLAVVPTVIGRFHNPFTVTACPEYTIHQCCKRAPDMFVCPPGKAVNVSVMPKHQLDFQLTDLLPFSVSQGGTRIVGKDATGCRRSIETRP